MPFTRYLTDSGVVLGEGEGTPDPANVGESLIMDYVLDAQGQRLAGSRKIVNGVAVPITESEWRAAVATQRKRQRKQAAREDSNTLRVLEVLTSVLNTKLPANRQITAQELRTAWQAKIDSLADDEV